MQLPTPVRAALGVIAVARDVVQNFPDKAIEVPMLAVSTALQMSLRAQQQYAALAAKGDALLAGNRISDEPPPWATFDAPLDDVDIAAPDGPAGPADSDDDADEDDADDAAGNSAESAIKAVRDVAPRKTVRRPRSGPASKFDAVGDD